ncbi:MAG: amidohydrolase family protein [Steroidobacteraceae bacterium]
MSEHSGSALVVAGATIIDGVTDRPIEGLSIWIEGGRIRAIGRRDQFGASPTEVIDASGKYVIPGLINANVHLLCDFRLETLARYSGRYEALIAEAAQVTLRNGVTTVFDTWGPRRHLMSVRDRINAGKISGSRIFCGGNIIGFDGPFSRDFSVKAAELASVRLRRRINASWVENVGRHLLWLTPQQVEQEVRAYIARGIDFVEYASNGHGGAFESAVLAFSPQTQAVIVQAAHRAGLKAQAHTTTVEGLRIAIEADCDVIQHANMTGPVQIPQSTIEELIRRNTSAVVFAFTERRWNSIMATATESDRALWLASDVNVRNLIRHGARLLAGNDGFLCTSEMAAEPSFNRAHLAPGEDNLFDLATGHLAWLRAMEEKGLPPMELLRAATHNIAVAYAKDDDLGSILPGRIADLLILDRNPLQSATNYRSIHAVIKDGIAIDRDGLPSERLLTAPIEAPAEEEASYIPFPGGSE